MQAAGRSSTVELEGCDYFAVRFVGGFELDFYCVWLSSVGASSLDIAALVSTSPVQLGCGLSLLAAWFLLPIMDHVWCSMLVA